MFDVQLVSVRFKRLSALLAVAAVTVVSACGGGGGATPAGSPAKVTITGTLSYVVQAKPSINVSTGGRAISGIAWAGATLQVIDATGAVIGTGTVNADGTYSVSVAPGSNYIIRVQSGNLVLKAFVPDVSANASVNVTPTTTAEVMVLAQVLGVANVGDPGVNATAAFSSVNVGAVVTQITANPNIAAVANTLAANIAANYDAASGTASIGAADTAVAAAVTAISATVSTTAVPAAPSAPTLSTTAMPGDGRVTLNWTDPGGGGAVGSHNVYYIAGSTVAVNTAGAVKVPAIGSASTSYTVNGLTNGTQYAFIVTAVNSGGETASASVVTATPSGAWTTKTSMLYQRDNAANAVLNGKIYVVGGAPAGISVLSSMEVYDPATDTWTTKASMPAARYGPAAVGINGVVYVFGGTNIVNGQGPIYPTIVYDPNTNVWSTTVPSTAATITAGTAGATLAPIPTGRWGFDVVAVDGLIYAVGGAVQSAGGVNTYYNVVEAYDPVLNTWTTKLPMPTPRWGMTVSVVNGLIYAIGGWGGWPELAMVEIYDPAANTWSTIVPTTAATTAAGTAGAALAPMPTARDDFGFAVVNGLIYAIGGDINTFDAVLGIPCCTQIVEAYDPVANTWSTKANMPTMRDDFDASTVDGVIYAIAGSRDGHFLTSGLPNDGGYSLTTVEAYTSSSIAVPKAVTATAGASQVSLGWSAVTGATSYNIYWSNKAGVSTTANSTKIANGNSTAYTHTSLTAETWYYYVVTAVTASGESLPSDGAAAKP